MANDNKCYVVKEDILKLSSLYTINNNNVKIKIINNTNYININNFHNFIDDFIKLMYESSLKNTFLIEKVYSNIPNYVNVTFVGKETITKHQNGIKLINNETRNAIILDQKRILESKETRRNDNSDLNDIKESEESKENECLILKLKHEHLEKNELKSGSGLVTSEKFARGVKSKEFQRNSVETTSMNTESLTKTHLKSRKQKPPSAIEMANQLKNKEARIEGLFGNQQNYYKTKNDALTIIKLTSLLGKEMKFNEQNIQTQLKLKSSKLNRPYKTKRPRIVNQSISAKDDEVHGAKIEKPLKNNRNLEYKNNKSYTSKANYQKTKRQTNQRLRKPKEKFPLIHHRNTKIAPNKKEIPPSTHLTKKALMDVQELTFLIIYDVQLLFSNFEEMLSSIFQKPQTTFIIVSYNCPFDEQLIRKLLELLWNKFNAINVFYLSNSQLLTFNPFTEPVTLNFYAINDFVKDPINKLKNLHGYKLRTSIFARSPTAIKLYESPPGLRENPIYKSLETTLNFGGYDCYILANTAKYFNFTWIVTSSHDISNYGVLNENGIYTGTLGDVVNKRIDISGNGFFYNDYEADDLIEFTFPINADLMCILVPKAQKIPQWIKMFQCFQWRTWILFIITWIISIVLWLKMNRRSGRASFMEIIAIFIAIPTKLSKRNTHRIFLAFCMSFTVIITSIFQGTLVKSFSAETFYADVNTLEQLDRSGLLIATSLNVFDSDTELMKSLQSKIIRVNTSAQYRAAKRRDVAAIERQSDANLLINTKYKRHDGYPLLHLMDECVSSVFLGFIVPKRSPYLTMFNYGIMKFAEGGLLEKWYTDVFDAMISESLKNSYVNDDKKPFKLEDVQAAFYILMIGHFVASIILLIERRFC